MDASVAARLSRLYIEQSKQQNQMLADIERNSSEKDFKEAKEIVAKTMASLYLDGLYPIFKQHPGLKPDGLVI